MLIQMVSTDHLYKYSKTPFERAPCFLTKITRKLECSFKGVLSSMNYNKMMGTKTGPKAGMPVQVDAH